jgi:hypothetical protein
MEKERHESENEKKSMGRKNEHLGMKYQKGKI